MAKKTKDLETVELNIEKKENSIKPASKKTTKKVDEKSSTKKVATKSETTKKTTKTTPKKSTSKKEKTTSANKEVKEKTSTTRKQATKNNDDTSKKAKTSSTKTKKATTLTTSKTRKTTTSKTKKTSTTSKARKATTKKAINIEETPTFQSEYYDLPYSYNKTVVKVLAQTPKTLFIYWEIAKEDRDYFQKTYGEKFFEVTKPILIVYNDTLKYSFEVDINDFANSWYLHINDANCSYHVELGRRPLPIANQNIQVNANNSQYSYIPYYLYITTSNNMVSPNNKILFNPKSKIKFRNIKTGKITEKDFKDFKFISNIGIFSIYELYKYLYPNEDLDEPNFFSGNPSSGLTSSGSLSSKFK